MNSSTYRSPSELAFNQGSTLTEESYQLVNKIEDTLVKLPIFKRLDNKLQIFSLSLTSLSDHGAHFTHSRLIHVREVANEARLGAKHLHLTPYELCVAFIASLAHDLGHIALSHTGEDLVRELGFVEFDHDLYTLIVCSSPEFALALQSFGIDIQDVLACLAGPEIIENRAQLLAIQTRLNSLSIASALLLDLDDSTVHERLKRWATLNVAVQKIWDPLAYVPRDFKESPASQHKKTKVTDNLQIEVRNSITFEIVQGEDRSWEVVLSTSNIEAQRKLTMHRGDLYQRYSCSFLAGLVKEAIRRAFLHEENPSKKVNPETIIKSLITSTDDEMLSTLPDDEKARLNSIDERYEQILYIHINDIVGVRSEYALKVRSQVDSILNKFSKKYGDSFPRILVGVTPKFLKKDDYILTGNAIKFGEKLRDPSIATNEKDQLNKTSIVLNKSKYVDNFVAELTRVKGDRFTISSWGPQTVVVAIEKNSSIPESTFNIIKYDILSEITDSVREGENSVSLQLA